MIFNAHYYFYMILGCIGLYGGWNLIKDLQNTNPIDRKRKFLIIGVIASFLVILYIGLRVYAVDLMGKIYWWMIGLE